MNSGLGKMAASRPGRHRKIGISGSKRRGVSAASAASAAPVMQKRGVAAAAAASAAQASISAAKISGANGDGRQQWRKA
jgi:hypothetical protein